MAAPMSIADEKGNMCVFEATTNQTAEALARAAVIQLGLANAISCYPMTVADVRRAGIRGSMTYCTEVGKRLADVKKGTDGAWQELLDYTGADLVFSGKVVDIDRRTTEGFARGTVVLEHLDDTSRTMRVEIQNENLIAFEDGEAVVTVPDLLCLIDNESADPVTTESLAYGQRLNVLAMPCAPEWHRDGMLELVGREPSGTTSTTSTSGRAGGERVAARRRRGSTNTDAVVVDSAGTVLAATKTATTPEPIGGIPVGRGRRVGQGGRSNRAGQGDARHHPSHQRHHPPRGSDRVGGAAPGRPIVAGRAPQRSLARGPSRHRHRSQRDRGLAGSSTTARRSPLSTRMRSGASVPRARRRSQPSQSRAHSARRRSIRNFAPPNCWPRVRRRLPGVAEPHGGVSGLLERENATILNASC